MPTYNGNIGCDGYRPLGYWLAYAIVVHGENSTVVADLRQKIEEEGKKVIVEQPDDDVIEKLRLRHNSS